MSSIILFFIGASFGSFINLCSYRFIKKESIIFPGSYCDQCKSKLNWQQLIPIISQSNLFNKCIHCGLRNPFKYTLFEIIVGIIFLINKNLSNNIFASNFEFDFILKTIFTSILLFLSLVDINTNKIPKKILYLLFFLGIVVNYFFTNFLSIDILIKNLIYSLITFFVLGLFSKIYFILRKKIPFGSGDSALIAIFVIWIGTKGMIISYVLSFYLALIYILFFLLKDKKKLERIPFVPFLSLGAYFYIISYPLTYQTFIGFK